jgi:glutamate synthase (NADPH/NADH) small chain
MGATITDVFADAHPPLTAAQAVVEANRCYFCYDAPCVEACPTDIDVPGFIRGIATGNVAGAALKILDENIFGGACARVCPTEVLCERACVWTAAGAAPIAIGALQRVATDWQMAQGVLPFARAATTAKRVAVVGAGPAGMACAHGLARRGHEVTVFEARAKAGGLNEYGIAAYKMADDFAARELAFVMSIGGISVEANARLGESVALDDLCARFDAVFLGVGQGAVKAMRIPGEDLPGVRAAVDFIADVRQGPAPVVSGRVVVIGGGNTAIDAATQAKLLGAADVTILYRRGAAQMSATGAEQDWARAHGVAIKFFQAPVRIEPGLRVVTGGEVFAAALVLVAVGQAFSGLEGVAVVDGKIAVDAHFATSRPKVFAGGDCVSGVDLTVRAVNDGKLAARAIDEFLGAA